MFIATVLSSILLNLATSAYASPAKRADAFLLQSESNGQYCLGTQIPPGPGVQIVNLDCAWADGNNGAFYGTFEISKGNNDGGIRLSGTDWCIDAGTPLDSTGPISWANCDGSASQRFYYTDDDHIALTDQTTCIDLAGQGCGRFKCSPGMIRCGQPSLSNPAVQGWTLAPVGSNPEPSQDGQELHFDGDNSLCLFGGLNRGQSPRVQSCSTVTDENSRFYINRGETVVKAVNSLGAELCLDYGSDTTDGQEAYFNDCDDQQTNQKLYYTGEGDDHIAILGGTMCLDLKAGDATIVQWWTCGDDPQQRFTS